MSLISSLLSLTQLVTTQRNTNTDPDSWGNPGVPVWAEHLTAVPCRSWTTAGKENVTDTTTIVVVEDIRCVMPLGTDVTEQDRLGDITYRGDIVVAGPTSIRAVIRNQDHLELMLVRVN